MTLSRPTETDVYQRGSGRLGRRNAGQKRGPSARLWLRGPALAGVGAAGEGQGLPPTPEQGLPRSPESPGVPQPHSLLPATATPSSLRSKLGCSQQPQVGPGSQRFGVAAPRQAKPRAPVSAAEPICQSVIKDFRLYRKKKKWSPLFFLTLIYYA